MNAHPTDAEAILATISEETTLLNVHPLLGDIPGGGKLLKFVDPHHGRAVTIPFSAEGWAQFSTLITGVHITRQIPDSLPPLHRIDAIMRNRQP